MLKTVAFVAVDDARKVELELNFCTRKIHISDVLYIQHFGAVTHH